MRKGQQRYLVTAPGTYPWFTNADSHQDAARRFREEKQLTSANKTIYVASIEHLQEYEIINDVRQIT